MNIVFLSPHFPGNFYHFCVAARRQGLNILGIADAPYTELRPELREALVEYYKVQDMHNYAELSQSLKYFTKAYGQIDRIDSHNEYWLEAEAKLRTDFNIPGIRTDFIQNIRRKSKMKEIFLSAGIPCARGILAIDRNAADKFIRQVGFPVIAKPDSGVGAANTYKLTKPEEVERFFQEKPAVDYYLEEFLDGKMFTFDGLVDKNGKIVFFTSHTYSQGIMETVNQDLDVYYYSLRIIPKDLENLGRKMLKAFDVRERFFHFEFFRLAEGQLKALEVNIRPPGGLTTDMFNYACDIDIYELWARLIKYGELVKFDYSRKYHCCYICRKFNKNYKYTHEEVLNYLGNKLAHHEKISSIFGKALGDYGYLVRSEKLAEITQAAELIQQKL